VQTSPTGHRPPTLADRRQFNKVLSRVLLAAAIVSGCGSSPTAPTNPSPPTPTTATGDVVGTVAGNHERPHFAIIRKAQLDAGAAIDIDISNGLHSHTVTLTGAQMGQVAAGTRVSILSSTNPHSNGMDAHDHAVTFH
jgi:hypothetical protein